MFNKGDKVKLSQIGKDHRRCGSLYGIVLATPTGPAYVNIKEYGNKTGQMLNQDHWELI